MAANPNESPTNTACNKYNGQATNINENSNGSVTPVKKDAKAPAIIKPAVSFYVW
jgi:hypothetical protein